MKNLDFQKEDLQYIWHPCTQMKEHEHYPIVPIKRGDGVYLEDYDGRRFVDGISSWWVNIFGHANPVINEALKKQSEELEHTIFAGFTHKPALDLAKSLVEITPHGLEKVFFADNGSSAVEAALKMAFHYFKNQGEVRPYFVALSESYHGETIGALSVGDTALYKKTYEEILIKTLISPSPKDDSLESAQEAANALENMIEQNRDKISAFILEPLIQCAGGMKMHHEEFVRLARKICNKYGIFMIADEIATGFGRTGEMFACEKCGISPDMMTLSKGLSGGYLPISIVMVSQKIYDGFYCEYEEQKAFLHSHSYTGNALGCAVANSVIELFKTTNIIEKNRKKSAFLAKKLEEISRYEFIQNPRQHGMVVAFETNSFKSRKDWRYFYTECLNRGVYLRPLGNTIYFMPPLVIEEDEIERLFDVTIQLLSDLS
ncbi:MAG: adenosylmethionine--8-amino-7-oxononanoate transaminase [Campylobacterales bacterium]